MPQAVSRPDSGAVAAAGSRSCRRCRVLPLRCGRLNRAWVWPALLALLLAKTRLAERALADRFTGYRSYAAGTPRLVPHPGVMLGSVACR